GIEILQGRHVWAPVWPLETGGIYAGLLAKERQRLRGRRFRRSGFRRQEADEILGWLAPHLLFPVTAAERDIGVLSDRHLLSLPCDLSVRPKTHDHDGLAAAPADGPHLAQFVRNGQQCARTGEKHAA